MSRIKWAIDIVSMRVNYMIELLVVLALFPLVPIGIVVGGIIGIVAILNMIGGKE